ncbi:hypothetical protein ALO_11104 [Acetonema longum DSM 6540]|uniref:Uncharacterized protein n=1 Tax=Acetonema longum DSM 6540 TaxID=1009370 RepID=F7NJG5_9FIRM|nr:hypothetical protein ALO_11104 [Acetonema longum DSM 6540]
MDTNDQEQRTWAKFQLKRAFADFGATATDEKTVCLAQMLAALVRSEGPDTLFP